MTAPIEAFIDCHPPTRTAQQKGARVFRKKGSKKKFQISFFTKKEVEEAAAKLKAHFIKHAPAEPLRGPLKLTITWSWHWYKYEILDRKAGKLPEWVPSINDPDYDNLMKLPGDVLTELGYWADDAHVSSATIQKGRGDRPGIHIRLERWEPKDWYQPPQDPEPEVAL